MAAILDREHRPPLENIETLAEMGIMGMILPSQYGGSDADHLSYTIAVEEVSRVCATTGVMLAVHLGLACSIINTMGTEEQKQHYLPDMASGKAIGGFCLTEPGAGSDAAALSTAAEEDGSDYLITGQKIFITNAGFAKVFIVMARTTNGISAFIVERDMPGLTISEPEHKMGIRGSSTCTLFFDKVRVPKSNMLGEEGSGFKVAMKGLAGGRIRIAAQALGIAQGAYEEGVKYAKERVQFGKPIAALQAIQWMVADMATDIEAGRLLVYQAADMEDRGLEYTEAASMAKLYCGPMATRVTHTALQIHGGNGYIEGFPIERMYRDARITEIYEGTSEIQRLVIARAILR
jgi:alkylation response protein AidB-like acyl-CoA dehydrogenase